MLYFIGDQKSYRSKGCILESIRLKYCPSASNILVKGNAMGMVGLEVTEEGGLQPLHPLQQCHSYLSKDHRRAAADLFLEMFLIYV